MVCLYVGSVYSCSSSEDTTSGDPGGVSTMASGTVWFVLFRCRARLLGESKDWPIPLYQ